MRLVYVALAALLLVSFQPAATAKGCSIDLTDPTNPKVYGDCLGTEGYVVTDGNEFGTSRTTSMEIDVDDELGCDSSRCGIGFSQTTEVGIILDPDGSPQVYFDFQFDSGASSNGSPDGQACVLGVDSNANLPMPCMRMQG